MIDRATIQFQKPFKKLYKMEKHFIYLGMLKNNYVIPYVFNNNNKIARKYSNFTNNFYYKLQEFSSFQNKNITSEFLIYLQIFALKINSEEREFTYILLNYILINIISCCLRWIRWLK